MSREKIYDGNLGEKIKLTIFGESHGLGIGCVIDGLPPGFAIDLDAVKKEMQRRAPGKSPLATARNEKDAFIIECGFLKAEQQARRYAF